MDTATIKRVNLHVAYILGDILLRPLPDLTVFFVLNGFVIHILDALLRHGQHQVRHNNHLGFPTLQAMTWTKEQSAIGVILRQHSLIELDVHSYTLVKFGKDIRINDTKNTIACHRSGAFPEHKVMPVDINTITHQTANIFFCFGRARTVNKDYIWVKFARKTCYKTYLPEQWIICLLDVKTLVRALFAAQMVVCGDYFP